MDVSQYTFAPLTQERAEEAFLVATKAFVNGSVLHRALGVTLAEYRKYFFPAFTQIVEQGMSLIAIDSGSNKVIGCLLTCDYCTAFDGSESKREKVAPVSVLLTKLHRQYEIAKAPRPKQCAMVDMAVVTPESGGRGVYKNLRIAAQSRAQAAGYSVIVGKLSSPATQHVLVEKFGHRICAEVAFADFEFRGYRPFAGINTPPSIVLTECDLQPE